MKASVLLYDQHLVAVDTHVIDSNDSKHKYITKLVRYDIRQDTSVAQLVKSATTEEVEFPGCLTPQLFTVGRRTTQLPSILAMGQVDVESLNTYLQDHPDSFFKYDMKGKWSPSNELILRGPEIRSGTSLVITSDRNKIIVFGGLIVHPSDSELIMTQQLFIFDVDEFIWKDHTRTSINNNIGAFSFHSATLVDDEFMVILGGYNVPNRTLSFSNQTILSDMEDLKKNSLNRITIYDIKNDSFIIKETSLLQDTYKFGHTATYLPHRRGIIVIGGKDSLEGTASSEVIFLSTETWTWKNLTLLDIEGQPSYSKHSWHATELVNKQLFLMNGEGTPSSFEKLWVINTDTWSYTNKVIAAPYDPLTSPQPSASLLLDSPYFLPTISSITLTCIVLLIWSLTRYCLNRNRRSAAKRNLPSYHLDHLWSDLPLKTTPFEDTTCQETLCADPHHENPLWTLDTISTSLSPSKDSLTPNYGLHVPQLMNRPYPLNQPLHLPKPTFNLPQSPPKWSNSYIPLTHSTTNSLTHIPTSLQHTNGTLIDKIPRG